MSAAAGGLARFGLIALLALGALLLSSASPVWAQTVDYDTDGDNLIEVSNLAQLNAIRHDLDGNGDSTHADYTGAFPNALASMGCAATCTGYELTTDLDFDTDSSGAVDSSDTYASWSPIGTSASPFVATFDGGGHTILKMTIRASGSNVGLFGGTSAAAIIRNLALLAVDIDRASGRPRTDAIGAIVGFNRGRIERSYATGSVQGVERVGGLAGDNQGTIANSYANVTAGGSRYVGGLAGRNHGSAASITNSYSIGSQSAKSMMYSTGRGGFDSGIVGSEGGIVGGNTGSATVSASYWNSDTSSSPWSYAGIFPDNFKKTTAQLQSPTGATGIYSGWSAAIWDFGTASQYPALLYDTDGDGTPSAYEFGGQGRSLPTDYDSDDNGLIEVDSLAKLNAIRYDLDGNGAPAAANANDYALAFPTPAVGMGCPVTATDADDNDCLGYELTADLDFNTDTTGSSAAVIDSSDDYWDGGLGWSPIASESTAYMAVFDGGRHTIANLFINRPTSNMVNFRDANKSNYVGLFASLMSPGEIRHLRLTGVSVTGRGNVGAVVGHITQGNVSHVSSTGAVTAVGSSGGNGEKAGGLVGSAGSASVVIEYSYSTATVTAGDDYAGGLIGESKGEIRASYATGAATATGSYAGGLVGKNDGSGIIKASYATGAASGADHVGGLAGQAVGNILSSYSRGAPSSSSSPAGTNVGGLVGSRSGAGTITNSYWDVTTSGLADDGVAATGEGKTTIELQSPTQTNGYAGIYANWNLDLDSTAGGDDPWDFGTASQYPALKADFNRDGTSSAADDDFGRQPRAAPVVNNSPTFSDAALSASIDENVHAGRNVGNLMTANDRDGDTLVYSLTGADGVYFAIDPSTAQIKSKFVLDYESKSSYVFQVKAVDPSGGEATMEVTVYLSDESEGATDSVDYDIDSDGLIEVDSLDQLDAMRHDLDGDGVSTNAAYFSNDFTTPAAGMGCPVADHDSDANTPDQPTCTGYELMANLDFNTDTGSDSGGTAVIDASDDYYNTGSGWLPIGDDSSSGGSSAYNATFEGNGYSISNLFISRSSTDDVGLFGAASATSAIRNVGLVDVAVTGSDYTGALIGTAYGAVDSVYSTGSVTGAGDVGGLMGYMNSGGTMQRSYSTASVTGSGDDIGGLVGNNIGTLTASYATGAVTGVDYVGGLVGANSRALNSSDSGSIIASYATGEVSGTGSNVGGLVGANAGTITNSYWDVTTSTQADDGNAATGVGKTTSQLQSPTQTNGYAGIYANWNLNLDATAGGDDPWDFGTASEYPALKVEWDGDGAATAYEFGRQGRSAPAATVDYDLDDDNLIEVSSLAQLNALRHDLDGNGDSTHADYTGAFLNAASGMGCAATCLGYELTADLDFNTDKTGSSAAVIDSSDAYYNTGSGWQPIGSDSSAATRYNAVFDGDGHTISNLFINRSSTNDVGLFGSSSATSAIRNVGLESANVTANSYTGALIGSAYGAVDFAYSTGSVTASGSYVGGLVGYFEGQIQRSYSTASVTGSDYVGGLVGSATSTALIKASYATGAVSGRIGVGGLVGSSDGDITASYSTGAVTGTGSNVGGLVGLRDGGTITNSYWDVTTSTQADDGDAATGEGKTTSDLQSRTQTNGYAGIYANWNLDLDSTAGGDDPWDFGTASQYPALKADFNRDGVKSAADGDFGRQPRAAPGTVDYDTDGDNLIEVDSLAKLNAIRWDLNGDGASTNAGYALAFPTPLASMGCAATCLGYELTADLDFDESNDNAITSADAAWWNGGTGWRAIGTSGSPFTATFDGAGHAISHLYIRASGSNVGLFGSASTTAVLRNLGLENVDIDRSTGDPVFNFVGGLVGSNLGAVQRSYVTGAVTGHENVGGLVGDNRGAVTNSYSSVSVTGNNAVGGLAGFNRSSSASITNSYAAGAVSAVSMRAGQGWHIARTKGGLVGEATSDATVTASYWDTTTSGQSASAGGTGQTTNGLQSPIGATGIYGAWAAAIWDFGTASEYPALKYDTNGVGGATWQEFGRQVRSTPAQLMDYDRDDDGLIDVDSLAKLHAVRWDVDGNGASANAGYALAFPTPETSMGCPVTGADADDNDCTGYELTADLDFDTHGNDDTVTAADAAYWNGGAGWAPIGSSSSPFAATFDGAGHAISNLFINRGSTDYLGLFRVVGDGGRIRNLGLEGVNITGRDFIGTVAGETSAFSGVEAVYVTGEVSGRDLLGGLIGEHHPNASLRNTYSAARVTGSNYVGGLLGYVPYSNATVYYSYARGVVSGGNSGGLLYPSADQYGINGQQTYWDTQTTGQTTSNGGTGQTTSNLKTPTGATGIYSSWPTATWDFGTAIQYPALKYDTDGDGAASWQEFGRQPRSAANAPPRFNAAAKANAVSPTVAEGATAVGTYPATDPNGDTLTYGKSGANADLFNFIGVGVLSLKSAADHERKSSYRVTLHVRDSKDADGHPDAVWDDDIDLIVGVDDDETESPGAPTGLTANPIAEGLRVGWTAPVRTDQPTVTGYGVEYKLSTATAWTSHSHTGTSTTTQITGLTSGDTYTVRVRALSHENPSGWTSANGVPAASGLVMDYDTDDDGLIEINYLDQLNAMRWDADGDGAGGGSGHEAAFPDAIPGMGCPATCTGYELEADLNFDTNGGSGPDSGDDYWNGGRGWAPFGYYGTFEGNRHTISNLYVDRPDSDYVGLFSTAGAYANVGEVRNLGLENVDVTGREYVGGLAGRAHAPVRRVYTTGEVNGERYVGGLVGEARGLISETYSKAGVSGKGLESSNVGGLVGYLRLGTVKASYATGRVSGMTWVGGLVGHNSSSDDGGIIASYATGNLGFGGLEDSNAVPGRWVDGFSSRYYLPYTPTWVGGLVGDSSGPVVASYSTGGHPISLAGFQPGERKDRSRRDLAYMMEVHWKIGGLIGKSYGKQEHDSYWDILTSRHQPGNAPKWVYGEGKTTEELRSVTGYTGIYADWDVDLDGDGIGDEPWDFGSSAHYPTLKVDWDGDGTPTSYEFGGQGRMANDHVPSVAVGGTGVFEVTVPENTPSGAPIFGVTLPLAPADASSYNLFVDAQWPDGVSFNIDATTGQLSAMDALDYESRDTYRIGITAVATDGARHSNGIIIRVTDVAEPPGPPTSVTIVPHKGSLEVSWTAPDMTGKPPLRIYEVTYYHDGDKAKITGAGTTTYTMTHLTPLITYAVQVRARNVDGWGPDSAVVLGTPYWFIPSAAATGAEPGTMRFRRSAAPPGQPANLRATPQTDGSALVTWDAPAEAGDDAFYRVRRRVDAADGSYTVIARRVQAAGSDGTVAHRDEGNGREAGQRYLYSVRAFDGDGKALGQWTAGVRDNRPPAFAEDSAAAFQVAENTAAGTDIGSPVTATDPDDGDSLIYLLGGADADHFAIDVDSGQLQTSGALDYESQDSYAVTVIAADGAGLWAGLDVTITVTDVKEAPGQPDAPEIIKVKQTSFRVTWTAPAAGSSAITGYGLQYKLTSEADSAYADAKPTKRGTITGYNVVNRNGQSITAGTSYDVRVRAKNAEGWGPWSDAATAVTASPAPPDTAPGQPDAPEISNVKQTSFRVTWTAPAAGSSAITGYGLQYKLTSEADSAYAGATPTKKGTSTGYNVVNRRSQSITAGTSYDVRVRARNAEGWGPWSDAATAVTASPAPPANNPPVFAASTAEVSVAENTASGANIGDAIEATDPDAGDTLTYTLGSTADDGNFAIDSNTGQLQTSGALDYEGKDTYAVTVTATDDGGLAASIAVTVTVDDVADTTPGQPDTPEISNIKETSFRITWTAPAAGSSAITGYGLQYKLSSEADSAYANAKPTPTGIGTGYNLVDRNGQSITAGTSYAVRVRARNAEGWGAWSAPAIAVTASPAPVIVATPTPPPPANSAPANGDEAEADDSAQEESADAAHSYQAAAYLAQGRVWIKWDDVDGAKRYTVQKNGLLTPGWYIATSFFDGDVQQNTRYEYRITAYDSKDNVLAVMTAATG